MLLGGYGTLWRGKYLWPAWVRSALLLPFRRWPKSWSCSRFFIFLDDNATLTSVQLHYQRLNNDIDISYHFNNSTSLKTMSVIMYIPFFLILWCSEFLDGKKRSWSTIFGCRPWPRTGKLWLKILRVLKLPRKWKGWHKWYERRSESSRTRHQPKLTGLQLSPNPNHYE